MKIYKIIFLNIVILIVLLEVLSFVLFKFKYFPNGLPPYVFLEPNLDHSFWHPKNKKFKLATKCWDSTIFTNEEGMVDNLEFSLDSKNNIALIGDSMIENVQVNYDKNFLTNLRENLPKYTIHNYSVSSIGMNEYLEIYEKRIKSLNYENVILFITENDLYDNYILNKRPEAKVFELSENKKILVHDREREFFKNYNRPINILKKKLLLNIKNFSNFAKIYIIVRDQINIRNFIKLSKKNNSNLQKSSLTEVDHEKNRYLIYENLVKSFIENFDFNNSNLLVIFNINNDSFQKISDRRKNMSLIWNKYHYIYDPQSIAIDLLNDNKLKQNVFLGFECDGHYSEEGVKFLSKYTKEKFREIKK